MPLSAPRHGPQLSEQLRRFLDDQVWFENRRVVDILRNIEARRAASLNPKHPVTLNSPRSRGHPAAAGAPLYAPVKRVASAATPCETQTRRPTRPPFRQSTSTRSHFAAARQALRSQPRSA